MQSPSGASSPCQGVGLEARAAVSCSFCTGGKDHHASTGHVVAFQVFRGISTSLAPSGRTNFSRSYNPPGAGGGDHNLTHRRPGAYIPQALSCDRGPNPPGPDRCGQASRNSGRLVARLVLGALKSAVQTSGFHIKRTLMDRAHIRCRMAIFNLESG